MKIRFIDQRWGQGQGLVGKSAQRTLSKVQSCSPCQHLEEESAMEEEAPFFPTNPACQSLSPHTFTAFLPPLHI